MSQSRTLNPPVMPVLLAVSAAHLINDAIQAVIPASYPILQQSLGLSYAQLGVMTFVLYLTSSVMQPVVGWFTDRRPSPGVLPAGMLIAMIGLAGLAVSPHYTLILAAVFLVGIASAVFHPEGARIAYLSAGDRRGLAQSIFQVGGNTGGALAPIMTALIFYPFGQFGAIWFCLLAGIGMLLQSRIAGWYRGQLAAAPEKAAPRSAGGRDGRGLQRRAGMAVLLVILVVFARSWYGAGISNYFAFHLIERFGMSIPASQVYLFLYMGAGILGTFLGGPLADRFGRKPVILFSLLGSAPFALLLPHADAWSAYALLFLLGLIHHSSFSVTVVYVQELLPGKIGAVSGLITGLAFGLGAIGAMALGALIDLFGLMEVLTAASLLPLLGIAGFWLPADRKTSPPSS